MANIPSFASPMTSAHRRAPAGAERTTEDETGPWQTASTDSAGIRTTAERRPGRRERQVRVLPPTNPRGLAPRI